MGKYSFKYGDTELSTDINEQNIIYKLKPNSAKKLDDIESEINKVLNNPTGTKPLNEIVNPGEK